MNQTTQETIDYAVTKLDLVFEKLLVSGQNLTEEFIKYSLFELHVNFVIAIIFFSVGSISVYVLYKKWDYLSSKSEPMSGISLFVLCLMTFGGLMGMIVNGANTILSNYNPLMWTISNIILK